MLAGALVFRLTCTRIHIHTVFLDLHELLASLYSTTHVCEEIDAGGKAAAKVAKVIAKKCKKGLSSCDKLLIM